AHTSAAKTNTEADERSNRRCMAITLPALCASMMTMIPPSWRRWLGRVRRSRRLSSGFGLLGLGRWRRLVVDHLSPLLDHLLGPAPDVDFDLAGDGGLRDHPELDATVEFARGFAVVGRDRP